MRTKTLLVTAAVGMVGLATSFAQVYSVNAVGYVNVTVPANGGLALLANPLNGTNNSVDTVLPLPESADGSTIFKFDVNSQSYQSSGFIAGLGWLGDVTELKPGEGFFIQALNTAGNTLSITFVGDVPQGSLVNNLAAGPRLTLAASMVPQTAPLGDEATPGSLLFPAEDGDTVFTWDAVAQTYLASGYIEGVGWLGDVNDPVISVATGFFVQKTVGSVKNSWVRNFSVN